MILTPNSTSATFSGPGAAPGTGNADGVPADQGFFGLLVAQAATEAAPEVMARAKASSAVADPLPVAISEPAAPIATALLVGQSWQPSIAPSSDLASSQSPDAAASDLPLLQAPLVPFVLPDTAIEAVECAPEAIAIVEKGGEVEIEEEDVSFESEPALVAAALQIPMPAVEPEPLKILPVVTPLIPAPMNSVAPSVTPGLADPELLGETALPETESAVAHATSEPETPSKPGTIVTQAPVFAQPEAILTQANLAELDPTRVDAEVRVAAEKREGKTDQTETARHEPAGRASSSSEQPAHSTAAHAHASAPPSRSTDHAWTEAAAAPDAVAPVNDTAQGGNGGLDHFSTGASHESGAARPEVANRANAAQTDFKALLAGTDTAAEPSRAVQIATVHLERAAGSRSPDALTIQLEPIDLGKIEVKLDFGSEGRVQATIVAEKSETLDLLQRDTRSLERALQSAGLQTDAGSLNFSLRGDARSGREFSHRSFKGSPLRAQDQDSTEIQIVAARPGLGAIGRVDIRI